MRLYLDASVLIALLTRDVHRERAEETLKTLGPVPIVSDLASLEFASAISRRLRMRELSEDEAKAFLTFHDLWTTSVTEQVVASPSDINLATRFISKLNLNLRAADAIHIALCQRLDLTLWTFDEGMAACAKKLGLNVLED